MEGAAPPRRPRREAAPLSRNQTVAQNGTVPLAREEVADVTSDVDCRIFQSCLVFFFGLAVSSYTSRFFFSTSTDDPVSSIIATSVRWTKSILAWEGVSIFLAILIFLLPTICAW